MVLRQRFPLSVRPTFLRGEQRLGVRGEPGLSVDGDRRVAILALRPRARGWVVLL